MIHTDLLDILNSGDAWVFVGSGVSIDAGIPSWSQLTQLTLERLSSNIQNSVNGDARFLRGQKRNDFAQCFQRMQDFGGQDAVVDVVRHLVRESSGEPGELTRLLADWPAAGYLTTNYDHLIEAALENDGPLGWISVGNTQGEIRKVSGDVRNIVWHIHGSAELPDNESRLVLGTKDYEDLYLESSELRVQLRSFLTQRRLVFVGFGFEDPEIMRLLKVAGRYTVPERPIYAFLGSSNPSNEAALIEDLRHGSNVEVIPYSISGDSHNDLRDLLNIYSSMILRRSVNYGRRIRTVPSYDPDTTGLLVYNRLVLQDHEGIQGEAIESLLSARILSMAAHGGSLTLGDLRTDIGRIASRISGGGQGVETQSQEEIKSVVHKLSERNLIEVDADGDRHTIRLTDDGQSFVDERAGVALRIREQFQASLTSRASEHLSGDQKAAKEVATIAGLFFDECIEKRSLGVAMVLNAPDAPAREFQIVALLQALPEFFGELPNPESARALIKLVQGVLGAPSEAESRHCGLLLQARLGVHLLGVDQATLEARVKMLRETAFVLDSTSLIPLLAVSGTGHRAALELMRLIEQIGAKAVTTSYLIEEVREHAAYATRAVKDAGGAFGIDVLNKLMGRGGERTNVFLSGFVEECASGSIRGADFGFYMRQGCGFQAIPTNSKDCSRLIRMHGVPGLHLSDAHGFIREDYAEVEELRFQIEEMRRKSNTYRHDRQVLAEAEIVVMVKNLRTKRYKIDGRTFEGAFFVSNSRFIDQLRTADLPITMRQSVLLQWLGTVAPFEESEVSVLMDGLMWELSERGIDFVDRKTMRTAFSSRISAAREEYPEVVEQHRTLIATEWGIDPEYAFREPVDDLEIIGLIPRHTRQTIERQQRELSRIRASAASEQKKRDLTASERLSLERLKSEKASRVNKNRRKKLRRKASTKNRKR